MWQSRRGDGYPPFVELLEPTDAERTIRDALAVNCRFYAASRAWSYDTQAWQAATYPGYVDALVRTIDGLRASLAPIHAQQASSLRLPAGYSAMECRLAFDWLQALAQQPDAPPFASVALAPWYALATADPAAPKQIEAQTRPGWHGPMLATDEGQKCRDCADFGAICPNSGQPCGASAPAAPQE
jgi:hypothetical protein